MLRLDFPEVEVPRKDVPIDILEEKMKISADVGDNITDIRLCMIVGIFEDEGRLSVILPGARMDGPYNIPIENVREIERGPNGEPAEHYVEGATVGQKEVDEDVEEEFEEAEETKREQEHVEDGILDEESSEDDETSEDDDMNLTDEEDEIDEEEDDVETDEVGEDEDGREDGLEDESEDDSDVYSDWDNFESEDEGENKKVDEDDENDAWSEFDE